MPHDLEGPGTLQAYSWDELYRARGDEVASHRPIFTGDVFEKARVYALEVPKTKTVIVLQHPCALRTDGVNLHPRLVVAEVRDHAVIERDSWTQHLSKMPLPELVPSVQSRRRNQAAFFDSLYLASPESLDVGKRIACLSQVGVNLLLQRWVNHNSRAVVPTFIYQEVASPAYEEADLIEEWCEERIEAGLSSAGATKEAVGWLREIVAEGLTRQKLLLDPQSRSSVRRDMRAALRTIRSA